MWLEKLGQNGVKQPSGQTSAGGETEDRRFWIRCSSLLSQDRHGPHRTYRVPNEAEDVTVFSMGKSGFRSFDVD